MQKFKISHTCIFSLSGCVCFIQLFDWPYYVVITQEHLRKLCIYELSCLLYVFDAIVGFIYSRQKGIYQCIFYNWLIITLIHLAQLAKSTKLMYEQKYCRFTKDCVE